MTEFMEGVNPEVLVWARLRSSYSVEEAQRNVSSRPNALAEWESGESYPTYRQLEALANKYGRPVALFFFPEPPDEPPIDRRFRTFPNKEFRKLSPRIVKLIRQGVVRQLALYELFGSTQSSTSSIVDKLNFSVGSDPKVAAEQARSALSVSLTEQLRWRKDVVALRQWRNAIEDAGIYVFKHPFKDKNVDGFCLHDPLFPVIYLNSSQDKTRQIFTLLHELAHLLLRSSGIVQRDQSYVDTLKGKSYDIERFCDRFAAEFLLPEAQFNLDATNLAHNSLVSRATILSKDYSVSRIAVLYRLRNLGHISKSEFDKAFPILTKRKAESDKTNDNSEPYYYTNIKSYLGNKFLNAVFEQYYDGACTLSQLSDYLGVKSKNISKLEVVMLGGQ